MADFKQRLREYFRFLKSLFTLNIRLLRGMWRLTKLPHPVITIFGGARIVRDNPLTEQARKLGYKLAGAGFSIITGGGPGIMEAANLGVFDYLNECAQNGNKCPRRIVSAGIGLIRLNKDKVNPYIQEYIEMDHFFSRKWLLVRYSVGFVVFPGGFGTMDELFELVTLIQCNRMARVPVILINKEYWQPLMDWVHNRALRDGLAAQTDGDIFYVTDSVDDALQKLMPVRQMTASVLYNSLKRTP